MLFHIDIHRSKNSLVVSEYEIETDKLDEPVCIVHLSDLHSSEFGEENKRLIKAVSKQCPDLILMTGDMLNTNDDNSKIITSLVAKLSEIAPVYYSYGNHEIGYEESSGIYLTEILEQAGASVLDFQYKDITVGESRIRIGGIYGYCLPEKYLDTGEASPEECEFLSEFQSGEHFSILMCHMPVSWMINGSLDEWDVDCVLSGHAHGGQMRLPFLGGLYAPDQGWFSGRQWGVFESRNGGNSMILSRGLGSSICVPRVNNIPEIVVVNLVPEGK